MGYLRKWPVGRDARSVEMDLDLPVYKIEEPESTNLGPWLN